MKGLKRWEKNAIIATPVIALLGTGLLFYFLFPIHNEIGGWVLDDLGSIPFLIWVPVGGILGYVLHKLHEKKRKLLVTYSKRIFLGLIGWLFLSIIVSLLTGDGDIFQRLDEGPLFKAWAALMFIILSASPTLFGIFSVFARKRWAIGATVSMFFLLVLTCMIFSQARSSTILDQDPVLSLLFVWTIIAYIEGINWTKRYIDRDTAEFPDTDPEKDLAVPLLRRQITYTLVFVGFASIFAYLPIFLMEMLKIGSPELIQFYELRTIFGMVVVGIVFLIPLVVLAVVKRRLDVKRSEKDEGPENGH